MSYSGRTSARRRRPTPDGRPVGAVRGLVQTLLSLLRQDDVTHVACAFDTVIESFRNELFDGYKTGEGVPEELEAQFGPAERAAAALGIVVWPMVEFEADDAIATAAARWGGEPEVDQVVICSPDKDMTQLVTGDGDRLPRPPEGTSPWTRPACATSSASTPSRSRTTWRWSATRPTASPACRAGAPSLLP